MRPGITLEYAQQISLLSLIDESLNQHYSTVDKLDHMVNHIRALATGSFAARIKKLPRWRKHP